MNFLAENCSYSNPLSDHLFFSELNIILKTLRSFQFERMLLRGQRDCFNVRFERKTSALRWATFQPDIPRAISKSIIYWKQYRHTAASTVDVLFVASRGNTENGKHMSDACNRVPEMIKCARNLVKL